MRRLVCALALLWPLRASAQFAPQVWPADQDGGDFLCYDVHSLQVNNMSGVGSRCVEVDSAGTFFPVACSSIGGVSSVSGTPGRIVATPTTGAVVVDLATFGSSPSCTNASVVVDGYGRSICTSGTAPVTSIGVTAPVTSTGGLTPTIGISLPFGQIAYGNGSNVVSVADQTFDAATDIQLISNPNLGGTATYWVTAGAGTNGGGFFRGYGSAFVVPSLADHIGFGNDTGGGSQGIVVFGNSVSPSGGGGSISLRGGGYDTAAENILCDVNGSHFIDGNIYVTEISTPATPSAGIVRFFASTSGNVASVSPGGTVNHGAQTQTAAAGKAFTALSDAGAFTETSFQAPLAGNTCVATTFATQILTNGNLACTQPAFTDLFGSEQCSQTPAFTGNTTKSAGSCVTVTSALTDAAGAGSSHATTGSWAANQLLQTDAGGAIKAAGVACSMLPALTGGATSAGGTCATTVNFSGLTGSASCAQLPALTGGVTSSAGSCATTVASVPCAALPAFAGDLSSAGGTCSAKVVAIEETSGPTRLDIGSIPDGDIVSRGGTTIFGSTLASLLTAAAVKYYSQQWSTVRSSSFGSLSILNNNQTVLSFANGLDQGFAVTAAGGTAIATTIAANYTNFPEYYLGTAYPTATLTANIMNLVGTGAGTGTLVIELFSVSGAPNNAGNYSSLGTISQGFTSASSPFFVSLSTTLSAIPAGKSVVLVAYRADAAAVTVSNGIAVSVTLSASNP